MRVSVACEWGCRGDISVLCRCVTGFTAPWPVPGKRPSSRCGAHFPLRTRRRAPAKYTRTRKRTHGHMEAHTRAHAKSHMGRKRKDGHTRCLPPGAGFFRFTHQVHSPVPHVQEAAEQAERLGAVGLAQEHLSEVWVCMRGVKALREVGLAREYLLGVWVCISVAEGLGAVGLARENCCVADRLVWRSASCGGPHRVAEHRWATARGQLPRRRCRRGRRLGFCGGPS